MCQVSVVITTCNRYQLLMTTLESIRKQDVPCEVIVVDDGNDKDTLSVAPLVDRYVRLDRPWRAAYRNPGPVVNAGARLAKGKWLLLQNAECVHQAKVIEGLLSQADTQRAVFARVVALAANGVPLVEFCGSANPRPYFFCGLLAREMFMSLRGFDEDYTGYGYDDDDFAERLRRVGVQFEFTNLLVHHQWHPPMGTGAEDMREMATLYQRKRSEGVVRNLGREWGVTP